MICTRFDDALERATKGEQTDRTTNHFRDRCRRVDYRHELQRRVTNHTVDIGEEEVTIVVRFELNADTALHRQLEHRTHLSFCDDVVARDKQELGDALSVFDCCGVALTGVVQHERDDGLAHEENVLAHQLCQLVTKQVNASTRDTTVAICLRLQRQHGQLNALAGGIETQVA